MANRKEAYATRIMDRKDFKLPYRVPSGERQPRKARTDRKIRTEFSHAKVLRGSATNGYQLNEFMDEHGADKFLRLMLNLNIYHRDLSLFARDTDIPEAGSPTGIPFFSRSFFAMRSRRRGTPFVCR